MTLVLIGLICLSKGPDIYLVARRVRVLSFSLPIIFIIDTFFAIHQLLLPLSISVAGR